MGERFGVRSLLFFNRFFKCPEHPFNLQNDGTKTYSQWEYEMGQTTIDLYLKKVTTDEMFRDKVALDIGCGGGGKTVYYGSLGVKKIIGIDLVAHYKEEAEAFAREKGLADKFEFVVGDAAQLTFPDGSIDTVIMNDAMEHVADPPAVLAEVYRVLTSGGRLYVNFPPYNHPYGAHLKDVIGIPYVHLFYSDRTLIEAYKILVKDLPDAKERIDLRIGRRENGEEYFSYLNKISIRYFDKLIKQTDFHVLYHQIDPIRRWVWPLAKIPWVNEFFTRMVVCILEK